jgi:N-acetylmuramoyl-L-alanine amidase
MILTIAALLQLAVVAQPAVVSVRAGGATASVPVVRTSSGPAIAPELLAPTLHAQMRPDGTGRYVLTIEGITFLFFEQVPFTRVGADVFPMIGAPFVTAGRLHVPLQVLSELLPRLVSTVSYDPERAELRIARAVSDRLAAASASAAAPPVATAPPVTASAPPVRSPAAPVNTPAKPAPKRKRVVVVDAGHGGKDPGTNGQTRTGRTVIEKDVALAVARLLDVELRKRNIDVVMTRSSDVFVELPTRGKIANERHGDLFISIHVNAAGPSSKPRSAARGVETYFLAVAKTEDAQRVADMENASVRFETGAHVDKQDPLAFIINDMAENEHLRESSDLASVIQRRLSMRRPGTDRGVKQGPFRVLVTSYMPAVLVELGFASNTDDAADLVDPLAQQKMAEAIASATVDYFDAYDRRVGGGGSNR